MIKKIRVGLVGYGKAGQAVAQVFSTDERFELCWIARRTTISPLHPSLDASVTIFSSQQCSFAEILALQPVDALVDFSSRHAIYEYGEEIRKRGIILISAISAYTEEDLTYARQLGLDTRVLCSPNMTLGINWLIMAAKLLRKIAPFADVEIVEQHFKEKLEVSGTANKIAEILELSGECITSLRLGGIVGHHEVIFGFPHQTVRLTHESIRREAFGTGAAFALLQLIECKNGFYSFDDLLLRLAKVELAQL